MRALIPVIAIALLAAGAGNGYPQRTGGNATATVKGVITAINGNRVTIALGPSTSMTIDDQPALNNGSAQNLYVGRRIVAYGFWSSGTFYAISIG